MKSKFNLPVKFGKSHTPATGISDRDDSSNKNSKSKLENGLMVSRNKRASPFASSDTRSKLALLLYDIFFPLIISYLFLGW
jgi:hypothetical protein